MSEPLVSGSNALARATRIAVGVALLAVAFLLFGSTGAFAASSDSSSQSAPGATRSGGGGLISGLLNPVVHAVDKAVSQIPVVSDVVKNGTVAAVVAPVTTVTDHVESGISTVPVVGAVLQPVLETPVLGNVGGVVGDVVGGAVDAVLPPAGNSAPVVPAVPVPNVPVEILPTPPVSVDTSLPAVVPVPDSSAVTTENAAAVNAVSKGVDANLTSQNTSAVVSASRFLPSSQSMVGSSSSALTERSARAKNPSEPICVTTPDSDGSVPCLPAAAPSPTTASSSLSGGSGGGSNGSAAADELFPLSFHLAAARAPSLDADWALPASMPSNPGSSPD
ncbi:hypothetical protein [Arthrobacter cryoconiti]|uniref:Uncharacterized protein n=1 Tax=Arthrobacter cryoconiti TaxID=748907 RepID=A0ABV8R1U2_9MICC|nr:hypothetical protein [Arthrobacter cryoconiti]MCC9069957.1 hypothetical protein [Arthrobacter cryoconiti]